MSGYDSLLAARTISIRSLTTKVDTGLQHERLILSPYGNATLIPAFTENYNPVLYTASHGYLSALSELLDLHANAYAFYFSMSIGIHRQRFREFVRFLSEKLDWNYKESAVPVELTSGIKEIIKPYEKLNLMAQRDDYIKLHYYALIKIISKVLEDNFFGTLSNPFIPRNEWGERNNFQYLMEAEWIIKQEDGSKALFTNLINNIQFEAAVDQPMTPQFFAELEDFTDKYKAMYQDKDPLDINPANRSIFF